jgi:hypothetical protein
MHYIIWQSMIRTWCVKLKMDRMCFFDISFMKLPVLLLLGLKERGISVLYPERTFALPITTHQL